MWAGGVDGESGWAGEIAGAPRRVQDRRDGGRKDGEGERKGKVSTARSGLLCRGNQGRGYVTASRRAKPEEAN